MPGHDKTDLHQAQLHLEAESRAIGAARYRKKRAGWEDALDRNLDEAALPPGRRLLREALLPTADAIRNFQKSSSKGRAGRKHTAAPLIADAEPEALSYLTLRCAIQAGVQGLRIQRAATMVSDAILGHLRARELEHVRPEVAKGLNRKLRGRQVISRKRQEAIADLERKSGVNLEWSRNEKVQVGSKLLELAADATGLIDLHLVQEHSRGKHSKQQQVRLTPSAHEWLERQHARCELLDPLPMPMVVEPRPWTNPTDGGYLDPPFGNSLVRTRSRPYLEELANVELEPVYNAVNAVQSVRWRINQGVLRVMRTSWEGGGHLAGLPSREDEPLPSKPMDFDTSEEAQTRWNAAASDVHRENERTTGRRIAIMQKMWVAEKLSGFPVIYFPHNLDWRGRVYPIPTGGPHPQDGDVGRGLVEFAEGVPLGDAGPRWLAIHLANLFGVDKVSFDERVRWVLENEPAILESGADPLDGQRFWATADKPWQALAACLEWAGYKRDGAGFKSHLPVALDGSNSGLQHFTALLRDAETAPHVNLCSSERPSDIYGLVAARTQALVDASSDPGAEPWKGGRITRTIAKQPCMTYPYSASAFAMGEQVRANLEALDTAAGERGGPPHLRGYDNWTAAAWLAQQLYKVVGDTVPAAKRAMNWLRTASGIISKAGLPMWWQSPAGLPVMQRYPSMKRDRIVVTFRGRKLQLTMQEDAGADTLAEYAQNRTPSAVDARQMQNGIAPNFVHSLDAAHLMSAVRACSASGIDSLAVVHDSFGTHAAHTEALAAILRETFVAQYETNPLQALRAEILDQLADHPELQRDLPPVPPTGTLDLGEIRRATYMFA